MHCKGIRRLALLCCLGIACLPLGGCSSAQNDRLRIAVIVKATDSDFWYSVQSGVSAAATEYNVEVSFEGPASEEDYSTQIAMIERAVENGADAIVLSAIDYERVAASVTEAARRGVRVVAIDSAVGSPAVSRFIGTDNYAAGRVHGIGFDANTVSVGMLETGEMDALIVQNPFAIGYLGVQYAAQLVSGEAEPGEAIYTTVAVANRENLYDENMQKLLFRF